MPGIGDLVVNLSSNPAKFSAGLRVAKGGLSSFESSVKKVGGSIFSMFTSTGAAVAGIIGGIASVAAIKEFAAAANVQIQAERKLEAVLKATGYAAGLSAMQIKLYASELQGLTNFGDEATINAAAVLATFTSIRGDVFQEALATAQDMSSVMGSDLQSSIVQVGKALNDPIKGVSALSKVGVSFNATQKEQIKLLQESGDLLGAQSIILDELKREFGGAAAAMANPFEQVKNALGDVFEQLGMVAMDIGKRFLPAANQIIGWANGMLIAFNAMPDRFQWAGDTLVAAFDVAIEHIKLNFAQMVADMLAETVAMAKEIGLIVADPSSFFAGLGVDAGAALQARDTGGLEASQARLDALLNRFEAVQQGTQAAWEGPRLPTQQVAPADMAPAAAGKSLWSIIMPAAENMLGSAMDTFSSWWQQSTPSEAEAKQEPLQFASAMQKGSADAFRTILAAQGRKSPEAQATDHLTQVVQQQVGAPLQQIVMNTMPMFAPEF